MQRRDLTHPVQIREALKETLGNEKYEYFFDKFLEYFFTEKDAEFFASLGLNCIRLPVRLRSGVDKLLTVATGQLQAL
jgi:hypothetical protein